MRQNLHLHLAHILHFLYTFDLSVLLVQLLYYPQMNYQYSYYYHCTVVRIICFYCSFRIFFRQCFL